MRTRRRRKARRKTRRTRSTVRVTRRRKTRRKTRRKSRRKSRRIRAAVRTPARGGAGLGLQNAPPPSEKAAAKMAFDQKLGAPPGGQTTLNRMTKAAYVLAYPNAPHGLNDPDFYDASQSDNIEAWVRIRDWVDYFIAWPKTHVMTVSLPEIGGSPWVWDGGSLRAPLASLAVPFAIGDPNPVWPVRPSDPRGCTLSYLDFEGNSYGTRFQRFLAPRGLIRYHIGHDCIANHRDIVVAPEAGRIIKINQFLDDTDAVWIETNTGLTILLGETERGSPAEFGVDVGSEVAKGQAVARVGTTDFAQIVNMHMVHVEIYAGSNTTYKSWSDGAAPPPALRNPTYYLMKAAQNCNVTMNLSAGPPMSDSQIKKFGRLVMGTSMRH